jgi:hypothetical protein
MAAGVGARRPARCGRSGRYRLSSLVSRFGGGAALPDVLMQLAHCDRQGSFSTPCGAKFSDLTGRAE